MKGIYQMNSKIKKKIMRMIDILDEYRLSNDQLSVINELILSKTLIKINKSLNQTKQKSKIKLFIKSLPIIKKQIIEDINFYYESDPSANSILEINLCSLPLKAIWFYRLSHLLDNLNIAILPKYLSEYAHQITGVDINPKAIIGHPFFIDHGTGVVIGETTIIGHHVKIYQGVTLGAKSLNNIENIRKKKRHPTIGNYVTIYADAKILGGETIISDKSIVKCNQVIIK